MSENESESKPILLKSVTSDREATVIESLLRAYGIPALLKHKSIGDSVKLYTGLSNFGVDIYVPSDLLEKAEELLNADTFELEPDEDSAGED